MNVPGTEASRKPLNILILMGDQHRWDALGCAADGLEPWQRTWLMNGPGGRPLVRTPNLDRLAATGVRFPQAVANLPVCVPCRHSFITGMYPHQIGILTNSHYWPYDPPVPTLPDYLRRAGYHSMAAGKMHWKGRNAPDEHVPGRRGWDFRVSRGGNNEGQCDVVYTDFVSDEYKRYRTEIGERFGVGGESREGYVGDVFPFSGSELPEAWLCDQAVDYLRHRHDAPGRRDTGQPFCLFVSMDKPHPANVIPRDYEGMYSPDDVPLPPRVPEGFHEDDPHVRRQIAARGWGQMDEREIRTSIARYLTNVTYVDDCMGKVLSALDEGGYSESTLVVVLSDHGELLGERGGAHTKYSLYDNAVRVPLIVRWPGMKGGVVSHAAVELIDLMPTWLDAAGLELPPFLPGRSLRPLLEGQDPSAVAWREATLSEQYTPAQETPGSARGQWTIRELRWKLIHRAGARSALYDLEHDPDEFHNLIDSPEHAAVRDRLRARIVQGAVERAEQYPARFEPQVVVARAGSGAR